MMEEKKQTPEEMKEKMNRWVDVTGCDAIRDDAQKIFDDNSLTIRKRIEGINNIKSAFFLIKSDTKDKYSRELDREGKKYFLSVESMDKIISFCDTLIMALEKKIPPKKFARASRGYKELFDKESDALKVEKLMKRPPTYRDNKYQPLFGNKSDILIPFYILINKGIIRPIQRVNDALTFCMHFGYEANTISYETLRKEPNMPREREFFDKLFSDL